MLVSGVLWTFGFLCAYLGRSDALKFGLCERVISFTRTNTSISPPLNYKVNQTIVECCEGFLTGKNDECIPMCEKICINSHCIGNNKCRCNSGYYAVDHFRCLPRCEPACGDNMACLAPNKCACKPDFKKVQNASRCEPTCSFTADKFECINAKCVAPNACECHEGHRRVSDFQCEPICSDCMNGECIAPDLCECNDGYDKNSAGICEPICDPSCINGKCVAPNSCECNDNFEKYLRTHECLEKSDISDRQSCIKSCQHGTCGDSGACICEAGYEMYNGKCLKLCDKECSNGMCLEDQCVCFEGYKLSENSTSCLPVCAFHDEKHDCIMGTCVAPQTCECLDGYRFLDYRNCTCVPMCEPQCINGVCTENGCICHADFYNISSFECVKNCTNGTKWVYDECIEEMSFDMDETDDDEDIFDDESTTIEQITSYEEMTEIEDETTSSAGAEESHDEGSTDYSYPTTEESDETILQISMLPHLMPIMICIILLSTIVFLIIAILTTFYFLYRRMNPKNIYYVNEQEKSSNSVYFARQNEPASLSELECTL